MIASLARTIATAAVGGLVALTGSGLRQQVWTTEKTLRVPSIILVDSKGRSRAEFGFLDADQSPCLVMSDSAGVRRLKFGLEFEGTPILEFSDSKGRTGAMLAFDPSKKDADGKMIDGTARLTIGKEGNFGLLNLSIDSKDGRSFGRVALMDSSNREIYSQPPR